MHKVFTVALDAGHGLKTAGKRCTVPPYETREWVLNNRIAQMVRKKLFLVDYLNTIMVYDESGLTDTPLSVRCKKSNTEKADLYISIHHNAANRPTACGTTVYHYPFMSIEKNRQRHNQAKKLYEYIINETNLRGNRATPVNTAHFYVLSHTNAPAFLIENGFMTSEHDCPIINTLDHANETAIGITNFIIDYMDNWRKEKK